MAGTVGVLMPPPLAVPAELVKQATEEDNAGNYQKAFQLYMASLDYFTTHLKYEKNPSAKKAITAKVGAASACKPAWAGAAWAPRGQRAGVLQGPVAEGGEGDTEWAAGPAHGPDPRHTSS